MSLAVTVSTFASILSYLSQDKDNLFITITSTSRFCDDFNNLNNTHQTYEAMKHENFTRLYENVSSTPLTLCADHLKNVKDVLLETNIMDGYFLLFNWINYFPESINETLRNSYAALNDIRIEWIDYTNTGSDSVFKKARDNTFSSALEQLETPEMKQVNADYVGALAALPSVCAVNNGSTTYKYYPVLNKLFEKYNISNYCGNTDMAKLRNRTSKFKNIKEISVELGELEEDLPLQLRGVDVLKPFFNLTTFPATLKRNLEGLQDLSELNWQNTSHPSVVKEKRKPKVLQALLELSSADNVKKLNDTLMGALAFPTVCKSKNYAGLEFFPHLKTFISAGDELSKACKDTDLNDLSTNLKESIQKNYPSMMIDISTLQDTLPLLLNGVKALEPLYELPGFDATLRTHSEDLLSLNNLNYSSVLDDVVTEQLRKENMLLSVVDMASASMKATLKSALISAAGVPTVCEMPDDDTVLSFFPQLKKYLKGSDVDAQCKNISTSNFKSNMEALTKISADIVVDIKTLASNLPRLLLEGSVLQPLTKVKNFNVNLAKYLNALQSTKLLLSTTADTLRSNPKAIAALIGLTTADLGCAGTQLPHRGECADAALVFSTSIKLQGEMTAGLGDSNSEEFQTKATEVVNAIKAVATNVDAIRVESFKSGSIIAKVNILVGKEASSIPTADALAKSLQDAAKKNDSLLFKMAEVNQTISVEKTADNSGGDSGVDGDSKAGDGICTLTEVNKAADTDLTSCLAAANVNRAKHADTPAMEWDAELAKAAQAYAYLMVKKTMEMCNVKTCEDEATEKACTESFWKHDDNRGDAGENLYWGEKTKSDDKTHCGNADTAWYSEIGNYDFATGAMKEGLSGDACVKNTACQIGHFTQVVWAATTKVGYGLARYKSKWPSNERVFVVARYKVPGNSGDKTLQVKALKPSEKRKRRNIGLLRHRRSANDIVKAKTDALKMAVGVAFVCSSTQKKESTLKFFPSLGDSTTVCDGLVAKDYITNLLELNKKTYGGLAYGDISVKLDELSEKLPGYKALVAGQNAYKYRYRRELEDNLKTTITDMNTEFTSLNYKSTNALPKLLDDTMINGMMLLLVPETLDTIQAETRIVLERLRGLAALANISDFERNVKIKLTPLEELKDVNENSTSAVLNLFKTVEILLTDLGKADEVKKIQDAKQKFANTTFKETIQPNLVELQRMAVQRGMDPKLAKLVVPLKDLSTHDKYDESLFAKLRVTLTKESFSEFQSEETKKALKEMIDMVDGYFIGMVVLVAFVFLNNIIVKSVFDVMNSNSKRNVVNVLLANQCFCDIIVGIAVLLEAIFYKSGWEDIHLRRCALFFLHYSFVITTNCLLFNNLERFLSLKSPELHQSMFKNHLRTVLILFLVHLITSIGPICHSAYVNIEAPEEYSTYVTVIFVLQLVTILLVWLFCALVAWVQHKAKQMGADMKTFVSVFFAHSIVVFIFYLPFVVIECIAITDYSSLNTEHFLAALLLYLFTALLKPVFTLALAEDYSKTMCCKPVPVDPAIQMFEKQGK